jgi:hypothetical protein
MALDQTPEEYIQVSKTELRGTAVFLSILAGGGTFVSFGQNISYEEATTRGEEYAAFKWIPLSVASYAQVVNATCPTPGERCYGRCQAIGCVCNPSTSTCVDASQNGGGPAGGEQSGGGIRPGELEFENVLPYEIDKVYFKQRSGADLKWQKR